MNLYLIEPRDPLIVRDGRPFGPTPGARATSLPLPFPSTTTGGIRTRAGTNKMGVFDTDKSNIERVKKINVSGPFLVEVTDNKVEWFAPAPADSLFFTCYDSENKPIKGKANLKRLTPLGNNDAVYSDIPDGMQLVGLQKRDDEDSILQKPYKTPPAYWRWTQFERWLVCPADADQIDLNMQGINELLAQTRMHVAIQPDSQTGVDGALFMTSGREFTRKSQNGYKLSKCGRLALAVLTDENDIDDAIAPLGGERRLMSWQKRTNAAPTLPDEVKKGVLTNGQCRLILMTPAYFSKHPEEGWKPTWVIEEAQKKYGVTLALKAAAVQRPQVVSGWDFVLKKPKPTRRLAPAGSVYYFSVDGDKQQIEAWLDSIWMRPISDDEQSRNDGFGVAVVGNWHKEKSDE